MIEKVLTLYDYNKMCIKGLIIVQANDKDYLKYRNPLTIYTDTTLKEPLKAHRDILRKSNTKTLDLKKDLSEALKINPDTNSITILEPFVLKSDNKNKSSRNKRMLEYMKLENLERIDIYE